MIRKTVVPLALAAGLLTAGSAAEARDGCGLGFHRSVYGGCRPNLGYRSYAFAPGYRRFGYRGRGGPHRHYGFHDGWHRSFAWHGGGHRWGGFRHAGWHGWGGRRRR